MRTTLIPSTTVFTAAALLLAVTATSHGQTLAHRYSFTTDATDSVGTANGTLGANSTISGGVLTTVASTTGAYNGGVQIGGAATAGITGGFSIESYITPTSTTNNNSTIFSFQPNTAGQNFDNYFGATLSNGGGNFRAFYNAPGGGDFANERTTGIAPFTAGNLYQVVTVYNPTGTGTLSLYVNGNLINSASTANDAFNFSLFQGAAISSSTSFPDPNLPGTNTDFRIYNGALNATQISSLYALGADASNAAVMAAIPEPSTFGMMLGGIAGLIGLQRMRFHKRLV